MTYPTAQADTDLLTSIRQAPFAQRLAAAQHPSTRKDVLAVLKDDDDADIRAAVRENPGARNL